jgi:hypothetical protein
MIGAAHDATMKEAGLILSHELITGKPERPRRSGRDTPVAPVK